MKFKSKKFTTILMDHRFKGVTDMIVMLSVSGDESAAESFVSDVRSKLVGTSKDLDSLTESWLTKRGVKVVD